MPLIPVTPAKERRRLHSGDKGNDVLAYQRMLTRTLKHLGMQPVNAQTGLYGQGTITDTLRLQKHEKVKADGQVGPVTWSLVDPQMHAYERYLLKRKPPPPTPPGQKIAHQLRVMLALGMDFYSQFRPAATNMPGWKRRDDCSGSFLLARAIALGLRFNGYGNTGTIWTDFPAVAERDVQEGDAALFGRNGRTTHVQGVVDASDWTNPDSIGFGSAPGNRYRVKNRGGFMGYRRVA